MQISLEKAVDGFIGFMADQVATIQKMGDRFLGFAALGALKSNPGALVSKVKPWMEMSGILVDNMVNLDSAKAALDMAFANVPKVSYFGFSFTADDVPALLAKMQGVEEVAQ
ncbi:hypothetical protein [Fibrobacter sp. UWP2]|uniref:hypothetical protein n=1 Tax=Fibrobacter sp. UWP2 TaxID=1896216 RepID=UPI00091DF768|nr:hypothetical protein [Fibrobacter sp. UWP2]SHJ44241.1 hypothetical protein SAMN05720471_1408 [Fibrobacter sp. UWP2]